MTDHTNSWQDLKAFVQPPSPSYNPAARKRAQWFLGQVPSDGKALDVGAGKQRRGPNVVTLDIVPAESVDCVADAQHLPFKDASFYGVSSSALLEYVDDPHRVVSEVYRVLKPGGVVYFNVPFLQGYHGEPGVPDSWRVTLEGLRRLCGRFEHVESGVSNGPASAAAWLARELLALPLSVVPVLDPLSRFLAGWLTFWIKYLDFFLARA
ncbi:MAG: class I SAM-dependent methyltransferase, partial [Planctomycetes bacterium]|nr:class I SAM-dependent methyltransferase [Planctomycetota bacterium]